MNTERTEKRILYALISLVAVGIGMVSRRIAISTGASDTEVSIIFWCTIVLCAVIYFSLKLSIYNAFCWVFSKYAPKAEVVEIIEEPSPIIEEIIVEEEFTEETEQPIEPEIEIEEEQPTENIEIVEEVRTNITVDIESIRNQHINSVIEQKQQKLQIALDYTQCIFAPHISNKDLELLLQNIELYADGIIDLAHPINTGDLSNNDLYHFGWNIHNHFKCMKQIKTAEFLQSIFSYALRDVESTDTIRKKLRNDEGRVIKLQSNLSPEE